MEERDDEEQQETSDTREHPRNIKESEEHGAEQGQVQGSQRDGKLPPAGAGGSGTQGGGSQGGGSQGSQG